MKDDWREKAGIPRRACLDKMTPAELAITAAIEAVEAVGADPRLTSSVILLAAARDHLADYIDGVAQRDVDVQVKATP